MEAENKDTIFQLIDQFLADSTLSLHTKRAYRRHLMSAFTTLPILKANELTKEYLDEYSGQLKASNKGIPTIFQAIIAMKSFLRWLNQNGIIRLLINAFEGVLETPNLETQNPKIPITQEDVEQLVTGASRLGNRHLSFIYICIYTSLGVNEISNLNCNSIHYDEYNEWEIVSQQKDSKFKRVYNIPVEVAMVIVDFISSTSRKLSSDLPLFFPVDYASGQIKSKRLTTRSCGRLLESIIKSSGLDISVNFDLLKGYRMKIHSSTLGHQQEAAYFSHVIPQNYLPYLLPSGTSPQEHPSEL